MPSSNGQKNYDPRWRSRRQHLTQAQLDARGRRLKELREARRPVMSQQELAEELMMSLSSVRNYETGRVEGSTTRWKQIARLLGVDSDEFFPPPEPPV